MNKKGLADFASAIVTLIILVMIFLFVQFAGLWATSDFDYNIEGVTRFQSCDITLVNLLHADYDDTLDFADAIASGMDVEDQAEVYLEKIYGGYTAVGLNIGTCDLLCFNNELCCSQILPVPNSDGECKGVELVVK
jgi:hypothetical protein